jgi:hypothetical protein
MEPWANGAWPAASAALSLLTETLIVIVRATANKKAYEIP